MKKSNKKSTIPIIWLNICLNKKRNNLFQDVWYKLNKNSFFFFFADFNILGNENIYLCKSKKNSLDLTIAMRKNYKNSGDFFVLITKRILSTDDCKL